MRVAWVLFLISGCVAPTRTIEHFPSQRMALSTLPVAPLAVSGSPGISLAGRILAGAPRAQSQGGAVGFPTLQPELGGLVQIGERTWVGGRLNLVTGAMGVRQPSGGAYVPQSATALDVGIGAGHDLRVQAHWGFTLSAEVGLSGADLTSTSSLGTFTRQQVQAGARGAVGVYGTPGPVRLFLVGSATTSAWNDAASTITRDCFDSCTITDTGVFGTAAVGMIGGGARWQVSPAWSVALELWVPFTAEGTQLPPMFSFALRAGDFVVGRPVVRPLSPPPPPPDVEPEPVPENVQL